MLKTITVQYGIKVPHRLASNLSWHSHTSEESADYLPRITCPKKLMEKFNRQQKKNEFRRMNRQPRGSLLISCKRGGYNFHQNENFGKFNVQKLVSCGWKNRKRVGDYFTLVPHSQNPSLVSDEVALSFQQLGISEGLCAGLKTLGFEHPTAIQRFAIPSLLRGENAVCAAETGSGKTLAYLLPAIEWALQLKSAFDSSVQTGNNGVYTNINTPNTVIITPNRELTQQVMSVAESLRAYADFVPHCLSGGQSTSSRRCRATPMDILIATPGKLRQSLAAKNIHSTNLQHFVIDESDTLLDDSFISELQDILRLLQVSPLESVDSRVPFLGGTQTVLFSATMPRNVEHALGDLIPVHSVNKITTNGLHKLQPHVAQTFIRVAPGRKPEKLIQLIKGNAEKQQTILVFTKNNKTCFFVSKLLEDNGVKCLRINGDMKPEERQGVYTKFKEGYCAVLVATDIMSRGLDTTNVQHVINYDFPTFMSDYIHRVGRVGRVGAEHAGQVTSFVTYRWDVDLLWKIETAARSKTKLESVNANIKHFLNKSKQTTPHEYELIV